MSVSLTLLRGAFAALLAGNALLAAADPAPAVAPAPKPGAVQVTPASDYDPTRPAPAGPIPAAAPGEQSRSFAWEVKSRTNTVTLFGTIHVGKASFYPLPAAVETAFMRARKVVVEADISRDGGLADIQSLISYASPDSLDQHIPVELYARLNMQLGPLGIPIRAARSMKPFVVAGLLAIAEYQRLGYDMTRGVDAYLIQQAKAAGKPLEELESPRAQLAMLAGMPAELQEAFLDNAVTAIEQKRNADQVTGMVNAWQSGDAKLMEEVSTEVNAGQRLQARLDDVLLHQRHPGMLKKIEGYLAERDPVFVAVGSLHLVGKRGLLQLLKDKGYEVNQK